MNPVPSRTPRSRALITALVLAAMAAIAVPLAAGGQSAEPGTPLVNHWAAWAALAFFGVSYLLVILEDQTHIRKSLPMLVAAGVVWILAAIALAPSEQTGDRL